MKRGFGRIQRGDHVAWKGQEVVVVSGTFQIIGSLTVTSHPAVILSWNLQYIFFTLINFKVLQSPRKQTLLDVSYFWMYSGGSLHARLCVCSVCFYFSRVAKTTVCVCVQLGRGPRSQEIPWAWLSICLHPHTCSRELGLCVGNRRLPKSSNIVPFF